jgi:hypothetical protein
VLLDGRPDTSEVAAIKIAQRGLGGDLPRPGSPVLRWALYEAALYASRPTSPDYAYFCQVRQRIDGQRALLSVARKLARRCYHTLRDLDEQALQPAG